MFSGTSFTSNAPPSGGDSIEQQIKAMDAQYHPNSPYCRFKVMFYNKVHPNMRQQYKKPDNVDNKLWQQAERNNPDTKHLIPVQAVGFQDLQKRIQEQNKAQQEMDQKVENERKTLIGLQQQFELTTKVEMQELKKTQADLSHRLLKAMTKLELYRTRDQPLINQEIEFRKQLEGIGRQIQKPDVQGRVMELASQTRMLEERASDSMFLPIPDEANQRRIYEVLDNQRKMLEVLTKTIQKDIKEMGTLVNTLQNKQKKPSFFG
jgi:nuclear pore complex protein Nup54